MMGRALGAGRKKTDKPVPRRGIRRKVMLGGTYSTKKQVDTRTANTVSGGRMRRIAARAANLAGGDEGKCEDPDDARRRLVRGRNAYPELGLPVREGAGRITWWQKGRGRRGFEEWDRPRTGARR